MSTRHASALQQTIVTTAVLVALVAQLVVHHDPSAVAGWALFFIAAVVASIAAWNLSSSAAAVETPSGQGTTTMGPRLWGLAVVAAAVAGATVLSAKDQRPLLVLILWMIGACLGGIVLRGWVVAPPRRVTPPWSRREVAAFTAIILLGAAARLAWIGSIPRFYFADDTRLGLSVVRQYRQGLPNFFTEGWNCWPWIGISLQGLFGPLLGVTTTSLRLSSALMGILAIGTTYLLAREMFTPRIAMLAALLFTICRTAIDFSRLGVCHAQLLFYETFAFFWWWRAINTGRATCYWWAGVGLGLCVLTYNAGDLVPVLWVGWLGLSLVFVPRLTRTHWRGAVITAAGLLAVAYPWLNHITDHLTFGPTWAHWTIIARNRENMSRVLDAWHAGGGGAAAAILWRQVWLTWLGFGVLPGGAYQELGYRGGGMLDDVTAALFVIGLTMSIVYGLRRRYGFVFYWWIATTVIGGVVTIDAPAAVRLVGILPALAIFGALPLDKLLCAGAGSRARTEVAAAVVAGLVASAAWVNWQTYFIAFANAPSADDQSAAGRRIEQLPRGSTAFLLGSDEHLYFFNELFHFNYPGRRLQELPDPAHFFPVHQPVTFPLAVLLGPSQVTLAAHVRTLYPHTEIVDDIFAPERRLRFRELLLKAEDIAAQTGLRLTTFDGSGGVVAQETRDPLAADFKMPDKAARLRWQGRIYWPTDRAVTLSVRAVPSAEVRVADGPVTQVDSTGSANVALSLPRGWQPVTITEPTGAPRVFGMVIKDSDHPGRTITAWDLNPNAVPEGLTAVYERDGQVLLRAIDPQLNSFAYAEEPVFQDANAPMVHIPFSVAWSGALRITIPGAYKFEVQSLGPHSVLLDDTDLFDPVHAPAVINSSGLLSHAERTLTAGFHKLEVHWNCPKPAQGARRLFQLYWTPPDGERELVPPSAFVPAVPGETSGG